MFLVRWDGRGGVQGEMRSPWSIKAVREELLIRTRADFFSGRLVGKEKIPRTEVLDMGGVGSP